MLTITILALGLGVGAYVGYACSKYIEKKQRTILNLIIQIQTKDMINLAEKALELVHNTNPDSLFKVKSVFSDETEIWTKSEYIVKLTELKQCYTKLMLDASLNTTRVKKGV